MIMLTQRVRDAEIRIENKSSNGPLRAQSKVTKETEYSATWRNTLVFRDMLVSC